MIQPCFSTKTDLIFYAKPITVFCYLLYYYSLPLFFGYIVYNYVLKLCIKSKKHFIST